MPISLDMFREIRAVSATVTTTVSAVCQESFGHYPKPILHIKILSFDEVVIESVKSIVMYGLHELSSVISGGKLKQTSKSSI